MIRLAYVGPPTAFNQLLPDVQNVTGGPFVNPDQVLELPEMTERARRLVAMGLLTIPPVIATAPETAPAKKGGK